MKRLLFITFVLSFLCVASVVHSADYTFGYTGAQIEALLDTVNAGVEPAGAVTAHAGEADPHTGYVLESAIGSTVQAYDAQLDTWSGVTPSANGQALVSAADYAAMKGLLDLEIGTDVQAYDADLTTYAGITPSANVQTMLGSADNAAIVSNIGAATSGHNHDSSYMGLSTVAATGDVVVGSGAGAITVITKGANNSIFGVDNSGTLGFYTNITTVFPSVIGTDDTYSGIVTSYVAGESIAQWDVVYIKNVSGTAKAYKYDADGADKAYPPRAIATAAVSAAASGVFLIQGFVRNDGWGFTTNQDEGKIIYAQDTTAGGITLTAPSTTGDRVAVLGYLVEENIAQFVFSPILVEVP